MKFSDLDLTKNYAYVDYLEWMFDERVELIKGKVFELPTPFTAHQKVSLALVSVFYNFSKINKGFEVFAAPFDVLLSVSDNEKHTVVQPDICIICDPSKIDARGCTGAPDIVVEILSPGNNQKELRNKYEVYEESGVKEYWIISPQDKTFLKYPLVVEAFQPSKLMTIGDIITTPILPGFELSLEEVFENV